MPARSTPSLESGDFFADVTFSDLSIESADLSGKEFERCTFRRCKLPESRWVRSRLEDCVFEGCDLLRMVPEKLALRSVTFKDTRLMGVDWSGLGTMPDVQFEQCDLRYSSFLKLNLRKTRFVGCSAREANFIDVDLAESDFTGTDMPGCTMQGCVLTKTNFARSTNFIFDPKANQVKGTRVGVETAVALAQALGMVVDGYQTP
uniref:Pentapeptide repeat domain protein n=1 Tax=Cystobacter sp. Cbv34 TaxID=1679164 RepID=A0A0H4NV81_9BACT|nr:pentapeptide repeat domain protein [Cystobacter sp. Cbv34]QQZ45545.1 CysO [synthetic construct]